MLKFLKLLFFFGVLLMTVLLLVGFIVDEGLQKTGLDNFSEWNDIRGGRINADLIIAGSSRAWAHVSPKILDSTLKLDCYNLGIDGHNFETQYIRYKFYRKYNRRPKYIVYCMDSYTLTKQSELFMAEQFAPYLRDSIIREGIRNFKGYSDFDYLNPFTKYQYRYRPIVVGFLEYFGIKHFSTRKYKGYEGKLKKWDYSFERLRASKPHGWSFKLDKELVALFEAYLLGCEQAGIQIVLIFTPEFIESQKLTRNRDSIIRLYRNFSKDHNIPFFDYSTSILCQDKSYFYNSQHLNKVGSEVFSAKLSSDLRDYFAKSAH